MADNTDPRFKPCPFCGNADIRSNKHSDERSPTGRWFSMCCYTCGARMENCASIEPMIEKWNRRVSKTAAGEAVRDQARMTWLQDRIVDTVYLDDGKIIDVKGNSVRKAIDEAMGRWPGTDEDAHL